MIILGLNLALHDGAAAVFDDYRLLAAVQQERLSRVKGDGDGFNESAIDEALRVAGLERRQIDAVALSRGFLETRYLNLGWRRDAAYALRRVWAGDVFKEITRELKRGGYAEAARLIDEKRLIKALGLRADATLFYANHHFSHALSAFFHTPWEDALLYTADGCGDNVNYSVRYFDGERLVDFYGDDRHLLQPRDINSLGLAYGYATQALGYRINRHEGKLTGLAAFGEPTLLDALKAKFRVDDEGIVRSAYPGVGTMRRDIFALAQTAEPADVAASFQALLEDCVLESVGHFLARTGARHLAVAGGVFANVSLNRVLCERTGIDEIFAFPAMGDEGLAVGIVLQFLLERDGVARWLASRRRIDDVYWGRDFARELKTALDTAADLVRLDGDSAAVAADLLANGEIGAIFDGRMEFGPRALGNRSILAAPVAAEINAALNGRLGRTEFMPFAPVVLEEAAAEIFNIGPANRYAARFMTITCAVKDSWRARIPAVVHVDGTARPQTVTRRQNPLYYDVVAAYRRRTGIPVLVNTSFNAHEEPIVNAPGEALAALRDDRVDFLITRFGVYRKRPGRAPSPIAPLGAFG